MTRLVVVGNGMVGSRLVEDVLAADSAGRFDITVLGAESCHPYNRVLLSEVVAGAYDLAALTLPTPVHDRLTVHRGTTAVAIDREDRVVVTETGRRHRYDQLVIATGSSARIPPLDGLSASAPLPAGVHALRTIDDAREIVAATLNARRAVVLGAGVLGLEAACGLARRGVRVTVVHPAQALMERQLDHDASRILEAAMIRLGIDHHVGMGAQSALVDGGRLGGVRLADGQLVDADLLVLSTGTVANTALAEAAGLAVGRGVVVGDDLASPTDRRIFAIGDCAQPPEGGSGLVAQGWEQSRRLAAMLSAGSPAPAGTTQYGSARASAASASAPHTPPGRPPASGAPAPGTDVVRLKAHGLDVVTMGVCGSQRADDPAQRTVRLSDPDAGRHVEVVVSGGALVGATCIGAGEVAADLVAAYTRRTPAPADPAYLLLPMLAGTSAAATTRVAPADLPPETTVCRCNAVTKADLTTCVDHGAVSLADVARATRATTGCGGCTDDVCGLLDWLRDSRDTTDRGENRLTKEKHMTNTAEIAAL
ncbi:FAD-dependent oxidoreductase [Pedococcus sp. 5OH_020]|uniref:FAD-dependent oxidoreductase n=1 Tax=Pedococcus sp. 5OH_020 TaxID=2989814 RepID=UPI0022E9E1C1|nr:FAD-dependent oxidoreductase [Pedococcus sp. 5OH_020]